MTFEAVAVRLLIVSIVILFVCSLGKQVEESEISGDVGLEFNGVSWVQNGGIMMRRDGNEKEQECHRR